MWTTWAALAAVGLAGLLPMAPVHAANEIPFAITSPSIFGYVRCNGPFFRTSGCRPFSPGSTTNFYAADHNGFDPFGQWTCKVHYDPNGECADSPRATVEFCLDFANVVLEFQGTGSLTVNQPPTCTAITPRTRSVLGFDGEDANARTDIDSFDLEGDAGETVEVVLDVDGSAGGIGEVATLRLKNDSGKTLAEDTGPLPLTVQGALDGPSSVIVERTRSGEGVPFKGYYTLTVTATSGDADDRALTPRENVEQ